MAAAGPVVWRWPQSKNTYTCPIQVYISVCHIVMIYSMHFVDGQAYRSKRFVLEIMLNRTPVEAKDNDQWCAATRADASIWNVRNVKRNSFSSNFLNRTKM